jgi:hypothetical protein
MRKLAALIFLFPAFIMAEYYYTAQSPLAWLNKNTGVRPAGMAEAFTGMADDINAIFYNPAGLGTLQNEQLLLIHEQNLAEINTETFALTHRFAGGNMGWTFQYNHAPDTQEIAGGIAQNTWDIYRNFLASLSWGRNVYRWIHAGLTVKYAHASQLGQDNNALLADIGILFIYNLDQFVPNLNFSGLGISIQNIFPKFDYADRPADVDLKFRSGLALSYLSMMSLALEVEDSRDKIAQFRIGYEIFPFYFLALRCGYELNGQNGSAWDGFSVGAGVGNKTAGGTLAFDVAARFRQSAGITVDIGMNWTFNRPYYYTTIEDKINRSKRIEQEEKDRQEQIRREQEEKNNRKNAPGPVEPMPVAPQTNIQPGNPDTSSGTNETGPHGSGLNDTQPAPAGDNQPSRSHGSSLKDNENSGPKVMTNTAPRNEKKGSKLTD